MPLWCGTWNGMCRRHLSGNDHANESPDDCAIQDFLNVYHASHEVMLELSLELQLLWQGKWQEVVLPWKGINCSWRGWVKFTGSSLYLIFIKDWQFFNCMKLCLESINVMDKLFTYIKANNTKDQFDLVSCMYLKSISLPLDTYQQRRRKNWSPCLCMFL